MPFPSVLSLLALIAALPALIAVSPALAADLDARSKIDAVTVFPDAAAVTRIAEVDIPAGATTLIFRGLPFGLDPASLRVAGEGDAQLVIGAVEARVAPSDAKVDTTLDGKLKSLRNDRDAVQAAIDALEAKRAMMLKFSQTEPGKLGTEQKPFDLAQWNGAWEVVGAGLARVNEDLRRARATARDLDEEIKAIEAARGRPIAPRPPQRDVMVALDAPAPVKARIALTYRIGGAGWRAHYDARLDTSASTKKPALELVRRASVTQRTGEDWTDVTLSVSTARVNRGVAAPDMQPIRLAFWEPAPSGGLMRAPTPPAPLPGAIAPSGTLDTSAAEPMKAKRMEAVELQATLETGPFQATFRAPGRMSVPGDNAPKSFRIAARNLTPDLTVRAAPALDETAFLEARFINEDEAALLPGEVAIFRDGTFVGLGRVPLVAPGDNVQLGFGADERVRIARTPVRRKENEPTWFGQTKTEIREFKTVVRNLHPFPVRVTIQDQIPISENTAIVVEQLAATTPPTEKQVGEKRGVMAWTFDLPPNEQKELRLAYRMKWPADREVVFQQAPVSPNAR